MSEVSIPAPLSIMPVTTEELQQQLGLMGEVVVAKKSLMGTGQVQGFGGGVNAGGAGSGGNGGNNNGAGYGSNNGGSSSVSTVYKVREFEWFEVETKVRRFVNELMQPAVKRVALDKRLLEEISEKISSNDEQVKSLYDFIHYSHNRVKVLDDINEKIALTNTGLEIGANRARQYEEKLQVFQDNIMREMTSIRQEVANVLKMKEQLSTDRATLVEYFENFKKNTSEVISQLQKELTDSQTASKTEFMRAWDSIFKIQNNVSQNSADLVTDADRLNDLFKKISDIRVKNTSYENSIEEMEKDIEQLQANISIAKKFTSKVEDLGNQFRMVENYVEKYSMLYVQGQISDTLFNCLDRNQKKRLVSYEEKVYTNMNNQLLLDDGQPNLAKKIQEAIGFVETIVKRNAKFHHNLKKTGMGMSLHPNSEHGADNTGGHIDGVSTPNEVVISQSQVNGMAGSIAGVVGGVPGTASSVNGGGAGGNGDSNAPESAAAAGLISMTASGYENNNNNKDRVSGENPFGGVNNASGGRPLSPNNLKMRTKQYENHVSHIPSVPSPDKGVMKRMGSRGSMGSNGSDSDDEDYKNTSRRLKAFIDAEVKKIKDNIEKKTWSLQKGLLESEEILSMNVSKVQEDVEKGISLLRKQHNNVVLETNSLDSKITTVWSEIAKIAKTFNVLSETVHKIIHFNSLFNSLALQDELDRQTIALHGYNATLTPAENLAAASIANPNGMLASMTSSVNRGGTRQIRSTITSGSASNPMNVTVTHNEDLNRSSNNNSNINQIGGGNTSVDGEGKTRIPIQLDGNCLTCAPGASLHSQHQLQIIQSFKLACLSYAPSSVVIDGQAYKREEILEVTTHLLQAARQKYGLKSNPTELSSTIIANSGNNREVVVVSEIPQQFDVNSLDATHHPNEIASSVAATVASSSKGQLQTSQQRVHSTNTQQMRTSFNNIQSNRVSTLPNVSGDHSNYMQSMYSHSGGGTQAISSAAGHSNVSTSTSKNHSLSSVYNQLQARTPQNQLPSLDLMKIKHGRSTSSSKRPASISSLTSSSSGQNPPQRSVVASSINRKDLLSLY